MPIQPIDLQVLFSRILEVGRNQAVEREAAQVAQAVQGGEIVERAEKESHSVTESKEADEVRKIKDQEAATEREARRRRRKGPGPGPAKDDSLDDPEVGKNIDITG